ncbi:hypothetical protein F443_03943, partial [Phytophthora nicotianae P1569]
VVPQHSFELVAFRIPSPAYKRVLAAMPSLSMLHCLPTRYINMQDAQ